MTELGKFAKFGREIRQICQLSLSFKNLICWITFPPHIYFGKSKKKKKKKNSEIFKNTNSFQVFCNGWYSREDVGTFVRNADW